MTLLQQYANRPADFAMYRTTTSTAGGGALVEPGNNGQLITGIRRLAQRFLLELLTEAGSLRYSPDRGCLFMLQIRFGAIRSNLDLYGAFAEAEVDVRRNLQLEEFTTDPDDQRYKSAQLLAASFSADSVNLTISLTSQAEDSLTLIQPISLNTLN